MKRRQFLLALLVAPLAAPVITKELTKVKEPTKLIHKTAAVGMTVLQSEMLAREYAKQHVYDFTHAGYMNVNNLSELKDLNSLGSGKAEGTVYINGECLSSASWLAMLT